MRNFFLSLFILAFCSLGMSAQTCKSNQFDMLQWLAPQVGTVNGHANILYPDTGTFYWIKNKVGYPWDVKTFDQNFVYDFRTENDGTDPNTYKQFEKPLKMMPRCINVPKVPGKISSITLQPDDTTYDTHTSCTDFTVHSLSYAVNEVWGPYTYAIDKLVPAPTLTFSYRYTCDNEFNNCKFKETFELQLGNGLERWTYYELQNGQYVQQNQTVHATATVGTFPEVHPCW